jgi:hypothetical protein
MAAVIALVALGLAVLLNLVATVMLARSDFETPLQRVLQMVLIWAIPFIGSIMVIAVSKAAYFDRRPHSDSASPGDGWIPGSDVALGRDTGHHGSYGEHSGFEGHGGDAGHGGH